jgi:TolA-binding protein
MAMHDIDEELRDIKREIIESRGLVIKTNNLTNALSADVKSIAKRQQTYERRISWNSATAYVVFVVIAFATLKFAWDARVDAIKAETEQKTSDNDRLRKEAREAQKREEDRDHAEAKAAQFYELVRQGKRVDLVEGYESIKREPITRTEQELFADAAEKARGELAEIFYEQGLEKVRVQRWQEAATSFEDSLKYKDEPSSAARVKLALARAYRHLSRQKDAVPLLEAISESAIDKEEQDDALDELAWCEMELESWNDAKNTWRTLLRRFPDSHFAAEAHMQLASLNLLH